VVTDIDPGTESGGPKEARRSRKTPEAAASAEANQQTAETGAPQETQETERRQADVNAALVRAAETNLLAQSDIRYAYSQRLAAASIKLNSEVSQAQAAAYARLQAAQRKVFEAAPGACIDTDARADYELARQEYLQAWWAYLYGTDVRDSYPKALHDYQAEQSDAAEDARRETREAQQAYVGELKSILDDLDADDIGSLGLASVRLARAAAGLQ
jgi:hypothetical protein